MNSEIGRAYFIERDQQRPWDLLGFRWKSGNGTELAAEVPLIPMSPKEFAEALRDFAKYIENRVLE